MWNTLYIAIKILFLNICKKIVKSSLVKTDKSVASSPLKVTDSDVLNMDALNEYYVQQDTANIISIDNN